MNCKPAIALLVSICLLILSACKAPPSVVPLLEVSRHAMLTEADRLHADAAEDADEIQQTRNSLADAFDADLREQPTIDPAWLREAMEVYIAAREALLAHELSVRRQKQQRADNLEAAAEATDRAIALLQRRDQLLDDTVIMQLWRLLGGDDQGDQP